MAFWGTFDETRPLEPKLIQACKMTDEQFGILQNCCEAMKVTLERVDEMRAELGPMETGAVVVIGDAITNDDIWNFAGGFYNDGVYADQYWGPEIVLWETGKADRSEFLRKFPSSVLRDGDDKESIMDCLSAAMVLPALGQHRIRDRLWQGRMLERQPGFGRGKWPHLVKLDPGCAVDVLDPGQLTPGLPSVWTRRVHVACSSYHELAARFLSSAVSAKLKEGLRCYFLSQSWNQSTALSEFLQCAGTEGVTGRILIDSPFVSGAKKIIQRLRAVQKYAPCKLVILDILSVESQKQLLPMLRDLADEMDLCAVLVSQVRPELKTFFPEEMRPSQRNRYWTKDDIPVLEEALRYADCIWGVEGEPEEQDDEDVEKSPGPPVTRTEIRWLRDLRN